MTHEAPRGQDLPFWTQREAIDFEIAESLFGDLIGWCSEKIALEKEKPDPDAGLIRKWHEDSARYARERHSLDGTDAAAVARVLAEYGPLVKALFEEK